jgi:hypothetical protein
VHFFKAGLHAIRLDDGEVNIFAWGNIRAYSTPGHAKEFVDACFNFEDCLSFRRASQFDHALTEASSAILRLDITPTTLKQLTRKGFSIDLHGMSSLQSWNYIGSTDIASSDVNCERLYDG